MVFVLDTYSTYIDSDKKQKREQGINVLSIIYIVIYYFIAALNGCFSINAFLSPLPFRFRLSTCMYS
jgi:hypothetical protein